MRFIAIAIGTLICLGLSAANAAAQIGDSSAPMEIDADRMDVFDAEQRIVWTGNVVAVQGTSSIRADSIVAHFSGGSAGSGTTGSLGDIERIVATDNVFYVTPTQRARADLGVYEIETETITLTGDVVITQCENVITTNHFVTDLASGDSSFGDRQTGERVRAVLIPQDDAAPVSDDGC
jgi:lipopolysaccharide export system protein LptA